MNFANALKQIYSSSLFKWIQVRADNHVSKLPAFTGYPWMWRQNLSGTVNINIWVSTVTHVFDINCSAYHKRFMEQKMQKDSVKKKGTFSLIHIVPGEETQHWVCSSLFFSFSFLFCICPSSLLLHELEVVRGGGRDNWLRPMDFSRGTGPTWKYLLAQQQLQINGC